MQRVDESGYSLFHDGEDLIDTFERLVEVGRSFFHDIAYVAITSMDSNRGEWIVNAFTDYVSGSSGIEFKPYKNGVVISGKKFAEIIEAGDLFSHFIEIWCFSTFPDEIPGEEMKITSEWPIVTESTSKKNAIIQWMQNANCYAGIGDGIGLNVITNSLELIQIMTSENGYSETA